MDGFCIDDIVFEGSEWMLQTCPTCKTKYVGKAEHTHCGVCSMLLEKGYLPQAIADQNAARIAYSIISSGACAVEQAGIGLGQDGRYHFLG